MKGEIDVERAMAFIKRQQHDLEWIALQEYWTAKKQGQEAVVMALYGKCLRVALDKYQQRYKRGRYIQGL